MVVRGEKVLKISVKGSKDGSWGLTQSFKKNATYHQAAETWLARHKPRCVLCFVQFKGVVFDQLPRAYLATPREVAECLKKSAKGRGDTILYEKHEWGPRAHGAGTIESLPDHWRFSVARIEAMLNEA